MDELPDDILAELFIGIPRSAAPNKRIRALMPPPANRAWYRRMRGLSDIPFCAAVNRHHMWFAIDPSDNQTWSASVDTPPRLLFNSTALADECSGVERSVLRTLKANICSRVALGIHLSWFQTEYDPQTRALIFRLGDTQQQQLGCGITMRDCDFGCLFVSQGNMLERLVLNLHYPDAKGGGGDYVLVRIRLRPVDIGNLAHLQAWGVV